MAKQEAGRKASTKPTTPLLDSYSPLPDVYDEFCVAPGEPRPDVARVARLLNQIGRSEFQRRQRLAESAFRVGGITFSVYSDRRGVEKTFPFDLLPRVIPAHEWVLLERGIKQRLRALNLFLADVYGEQRILREGRIPAALVETSEGYRKSMRGIKPPGGFEIADRYDCGPDWKPSSP